MDFFLEDWKRITEYQSIKDNWNETIKREDVYTQVKLSQPQRRSNKYISSHIA
jgi:hypothetical protein